MAQVVLCSWSGCHHDTKVKPEAATAVIELLMMGGKTPEICWAVDERQDNKLENCCIWLVISLNCTMMHGLTNLKCIFMTWKNPGHLACRTQFCGVPCRALKTSKNGTICTPHCVEQLARWLARHCWVPAVSHLGSAFRATGLVGANTNASRIDLAPGEFGNRNN